MPQTLPIRQRVIDHGRRRARTLTGVTALGSAVIILGACGAVANSEDDAEAFYEGRNVEILVPFDPGGGTDVTARYVVNYLAEHLEGSSGVQVVNVPGAGSIQGTNQFALGGGEEGNFIFTSSSTTTAYLLGEEGVQFDLRDFVPIVGVPAGSLVYVTPETGFTGDNYEKLQDPDVPLVYGGISVSGGDLTRAMTFDELWGLDVQYVMGYEGRGPARVAFEQGETTIDSQSAAAYISSVEPMIAEGTAVPVSSSGFISDGELVRDPNFPDLPHTGEVIEQLTGSAPSGIAWDTYLTLTAANNTMQKVMWMHRDAPAEAVDAARAAVDAMLEDPAFYDGAGDAFGGYEVILDDDLTQQVDVVVNSPKEQIDWLRDYIATEHGVELTAD